ncbi:MAG TPA: CHAT domain-containing tetratricopeptide repeat protein [Candidatus Binatia bacterium]|nr:CHAT domain-containing tetratricopeptide repeat protein [Candidatus Binatia bacterium]
MRRCRPGSMTSCVLLLGLLTVSWPATLAAQTPPPPALQRARDLNTQAVERCRRGEHAEAIPKAREALALREKALGPRHTLVAESLQTLADCLRDAAEYTEARPLYERALAIREKALGPEHAVTAWNLHELGVLFLRTGDYAAARPLLERGLAIREKVYGPEHPNVATSVQDLGILFYSTGDLAAAQPLLERAIAIREKTLGPAHASLGLTTLYLGRLHRDRGDFATARPLLERSVAIREAAQPVSVPNVTTSLTHLGLLYVQMGDYATARPLLERALAMREQALGPDHLDVAASLNELGVLLQRTGDYAGAQARHERALAIQERRLGPNHPAVASTLINVANTHRGAGAFATARPLAERALAIREQALGPTHPGVAGALHTVAYLLYMSGDFAGARPLYERALAIREAAQGRDHRDLSGLLTDYGLLLVAVGDLAGARRTYERAIRIAEQANGPDSIALAPMLNSQGALLRQIGDYAAARAAIERSVAIRERVLGPDHPDLARSLVELASVLTKLKQGDAARPLYERAIRIRERAFGPDHPAVAGALNALALLDRLQGRHTEARRLYERALKIREAALPPEHVEVIWSLNNLAALLRVMGDYDAAQPLLERAVPVARRLGVPDLRWRVTFGLARTYEQRGRLEEALALYRDSVNTLETLAGQFGDDAARSQFLAADNRLLAYDGLTRVLLELHGRDSSKGYDRDAWAVIEARKGRVVADALATARPALRDAAARQAAEQVQAKEQQTRALEAALREEQEASASQPGTKRLESLTTLLAQTKAEYLAQAQAFLAKYPQYKAQFIDQQTVDPKALAKFADRLPPGTLAIQYFAAPDTLYLFVVAPGGSFQVRSRAITQEELYGLVKEYRTHLNAATTEHLPWIDDGSAAYREKVAPLREVSRKLSALLLDPVSPELATHRNLVLIPNDMLLYLPIHALTRTERDGSTRFLVETHVVSYVTQLELVDLLTPSQPAANVPLLAVANPDGSLPAATREVRELTRIRAGSTALEGEQATKQRFISLAAQFPDVHMATHGVLDSERPERSYLLMAGPDEESRHLSVTEIASLSLGRNGMAVLSACETAVGEQVPGAALTTLAAAFSQAGAQSVVASLWKVNDATTRQFMVVFHKALATSGRAAALQQAQLTILRNQATAHPFYWAPFILIGGR